MWIFREKIENLSSGARVLHNLKFGQFTSLSGRERNRNAYKCKLHVQGVQSFCFCLLYLFFDRVLGLAEAPSYLLQDHVYKDARELPELPTNV